MVFGRLLAALGGRMMDDEDYQVLLSDGQMFGQLWVLGAEDAAAGGRQKKLCCRNTDR